MILKATCTASVELYAILIVPFTHATSEETHGMPGDELNCVSEQATCQQQGVNAIAQSDKSPAA